MFNHKTWQKGRKTLKKRILYFHTVRKFSTKQKIRMKILPQYFLAAVFALLLAAATADVDAQTGGGREGRGGGGERVLVIGQNHKILGSHFALAAHLVRILAAEPRVAYVVYELQTEFRWFRSSGIISECGTIEEFTAGI
jgi:hypothetical protein